MAGTEEGRVGLQLGVEVGLRHRSRKVLDVLYRHQTLKSKNC